MRRELVAAREQLGLTQVQISSELGISRSYYGLIETGARNPNYGLATRIARKVNKPINSIFFDLDGFKMKQRLPLNTDPDSAA